MLDGLKAGDGPAELHALAGVIQGQIEDPLQGARYLLRSQGSTHALQGLQGIRPWKLSRFQRTRGVEAHRPQGFTGEIGARSETAGGCRNQRHYRHLTVRRDYCQMHPMGGVGHVVNRSVQQAVVVELDALPGVHRRHAHGPRRHLQPRLSQQPAGA